jgi:radical SAM superfamily enzyme YgiQ (UPF0313 family)
MKVLLINPCRTFTGEGNQGVRLSIPLGLMGIASFLEQNGVEVSIFDPLIDSQTRIREVGPDSIHFGTDDDHIRGVVRRERPDIVGIGAPFTAQAHNALGVADLVKQVDPNIFVVGGGPHFSVAHKDFLTSNPNFDCIVCGEGEIPMLAIVNALKDGRHLDGIKGVSFRKRDPASGQIRIEMSSPEVIPNLDLLPYPAYHLIDMNLLFRFQEQGLHARRGAKHRTVSMITSRGCPYRCVFCSIALHMGKKVRTHSEAYVVKHIDYLLREYGVEHILFEDDNLTYYPHRTQRIFEEIQRRKMPFTWSTPNGVRADILSYDMLKVFKDTGCQYLIVGTESGDQDTLNNIVQKNLDLESVVQVAGWCKEIGIQLKSFFIIGFPGETKQKIQNTIDFATMLNERFGVVPLLHFATPLIGTALYDQVMENDHLSREISPSSLAVATSTKGRSLITTADFSPDDLIAFSEQLSRRVEQNEGTLVQDIKVLHTM